MSSVTEASPAPEPPSRRRAAEPALPPPSPAPVIRAPRPADREALAELIAEDGLFTADEVVCALELVDTGLEQPDGDYRLLVAEVEGRTAAYVCFGPTPMTASTWDLYWLATHPGHRGRGLASGLVEGMERLIRAAGGQRVRVETSHQSEYLAAHRFYRRHAFDEAARLRDFYKPGDDLVILMKQL